MQRIDAFSKPHCVYAIMLNGCGEKVYIGCTSDTDRRFSQHITNMLNPNPKHDPGGAKLLYEEFKNKGLKESDIHFYIIKSGLTYGEARRLESELIALASREHAGGTWNIRQAKTIKTSNSHMHEGYPPIAIFAGRC